jgi:hypothetical protein
MSSSSPQLIIQSICTTWTKQSRGGIHATARNQTPETVEIPVFALLIPDDTLLLHTTHYYERNLFQKPWEKIDLQQPTESDQTFRYNCLKLTRTENSLAATLEWEHIRGKPRRLDFLRTGYTIHPDQWCQVAYNIRIAEEETVYKKYILNVGFAASYSPTLFLDTSPAHTYRDIVQLW